MPVGLDYVAVANPLFDFSTDLRNSINCDRLEYLSPPPSPRIFSSTVPASADLEGLSPLTSPDPSPPSCPTTSSLEPLPFDLSSLATPHSPPSRPTTSSLEPLPLDISSLATTHLSATRLSASSSPTASLHPDIQPLPDKKPSRKPAQRKARQHAAQKAWRQRKRAEARDNVGSHYKARDNAYLKHVKPAKSIECSWDASKATVSSSAFVGPRSTSGRKREYGLEELVGEGSKFQFKEIKWNGSTPTAVVDAQKRVVCILAGHPDDPSWPDLQSQAAEALKSRRKRCQIPKQRRKHRRGAFVALNCGVSHGGGQKAPGNLRNDSPNAEILEELNTMEPFKRIAGFVSSVMATWAPDLHGYYSRTIDTLHASDPSLKRIFPSGVFSAATYNLGPRTVCYEHLDPGNLAFGSCSVTPVGKFDHTKGGHLILWNLHLVVQFPAGSTILLPSAIVAHSNVKIAKHETRYSFAQYTAGALFRWVDNHSMTRANYLSSLSQQELEDDHARSLARWQYGLSLIPTYSPPKEFEATDSKEAVDSSR